MKIEHITCKNIQAIKEIDIPINESSIVISGKNGEGKTTILESLGRLYSAVSVRIEVESDGDKLKRPLGMLKGLVGEFLDPHKAMSLSEKEQLELFMKECNVGFNFDEYAKERERLYRERTYVSKKSRKETTILENMFCPEDIQDEISISSLLEELNASIEFNEENDRRIKNLSIMKRKRDELYLKIEEYSKKRDTLLRELEELSTEVEVEEKLVSGLKEFYRQKEKRDKLIDEAGILTLRIDTLDEAREIAFSNATIGIEGLSVGFKKNGAAALYMNGVPLVQESTSKRIETWLRILMMGNPKIKVVFIDGAESLDIDNLIKIENTCKEKGYQVFMTFVGEIKDDDGRMKIIIDDGEIGM